MPLIQVRLIEDVFSAKQKNEIIEKVDRRDGFYRGGEHARRNLGHNRGGAER